MGIVVSSFSEGSGLFHHIEFHLCYNNYKEEIRGLYYTARLMKIISTYESSGLLVIQKLHAHLNAMFK